MTFEIGDRVRCLVGPEIGRVLSVVDTDSGELLDIEVMDLANGRSSSWVSSKRFERYSPLADHLTKLARAETSKNLGDMLKVVGLSEVQDTLTVRDQFAMAALIALPHNEASTLASCAYDIADAMLAERAKVKP